MPAFAGGHGRHTQACQDLVPVQGEVVTAEGPALLVHKDMARILNTLVGGEDVPALGHVHLHDLAELWGEGEADGMIPPHLILVVGQVHVQALWCLLQLVAMTSASMLAIRVQARACICWDHEVPYAGDPDGREVAKDCAEEGKVMQIPCKPVGHALCGDAGKDLLLLMLDCCHKLSC